MTGFEDQNGSCADIDECADSPCSENASCNNFGGGFTCACNSGFFGDGINCVDVNECDNDNQCPENASCVNFDGGFSCSCNEGFDGPTCEDIDECTLMLDNCADHALCSNTEG